MNDDYSQGYYFSNGLPCRDDFMATIADFYEYAKKQGCNDTPQQFFDKFGDAVARGIYHNTDKNFKE